MDSTTFAPPLLSFFEDTNPGSDHDRRTYRQISGTDHARPGRSQHHLARPPHDKDDLKYLEQAQHEFRVGRMFDHPNLLKVYMLETESDWLFRVKKVLLLLEYVNGKTVDKVPPLKLPQLVQVFVRVAAGLVHMHKKGVFHADLKPNNIMLSRTGQVKVIDYGLSWIKGQSKGRIQGTAEYIAPETAKNKQINERTDIYNFGATMYRLVTGQLPPAMVTGEERLPIDGRSFIQLLKPVKDCNPQAPRMLCDIIHNCLAFDPAHRPQRMSEVQGTLDHLTDEMVKKYEDCLEALEMMEVEW
jgi:serine/threonine protein kinase